MQIKPALLRSSQIVSLLLLLSLAASITAHDEELEFDYVRGSERGPERWGEIKEEWATCSTGRMQSPINLFQRGATTTVPKSEKITVSYSPGEALLRNRGHDIEIEWIEKNSKIQINGTDYILQQAHWHSPSEHTINQKRFDLELHMVHQSRDGKIAVIALLYQIGKPDRFLSTLSLGIRAISYTGDEIDVGKINPEEIMKLWKNYSYYRYMGSLTTPPCTEGVLWTVNARIATVSEKQVDLLRDAVDEVYNRLALYGVPSEYILIFLLCSVCSVQRAMHDLCSH